MYQSHLMNKSPNPEKPSPDYSPNPPVSKLGEKKIPSLNTTLGKFPLALSFNPLQGLSEAHSPALPAPSTQSSLGLSKAGNTL